MADLKTRQGRWQQKALMFTCLDLDKTSEALGLLVGRSGPLRRGCGLCPAERMKGCGKTSRNAYR